VVPAGHVSSHDRVPYQTSILDLGQVPLRVEARPKNPELLADRIDLSRGVLVSFWQVANLQKVLGLAELKLAEAQGVRSVA
jgi:hypothetical protein